MRKHDFLQFYALLFWEKCFKKQEKAKINQFYLKKWLLKHSRDTYMNI